jgi:hypothetical protein
MGLSRRFAILLPLALCCGSALAAGPGFELAGGSGPGKGKHIVLVTGDEEYRSEQGLTQLARILAQRHGFRCTVLYAIDRNDGTINPNQRDNIPGLEALDKADLMIVLIRWRDMPDDQMKHLVNYIESGKPIIGMRTSTHAFKLDSSQTYQRYTWNSKEWEGGFGKQVLGETWVSHHGKHGKQATRGRIAPGEAKHPVLRGIGDGEIFGPTDVYTVRLPLPGDSRPLLLGQVIEGMRPEDPPAEGKQNDPMLPVAWVKSYVGQKGKTARVFTTTMGDAQDIANSAFRRLLVNAVYWSLGMESRIPAKADVDLVGEYKALPFRANGFEKGVKPSDLR